MASGVKGEVRVEGPGRSERAVARRSAEARATIPDLDLEAEAELPPAAAGPSTGAIVRACALALREVPRANGSYRDGQFELYSRVNVGVVLAATGTYVIPTVFDADEKPAAAIDEELETLRRRAYAEELGAPELGGATFTLWNAGSDGGVARATPVIVPPQAAALAAGAVRDVAVVRGADIVPGQAMTLTLACDHRILYGSEASRFLGRIKTLIEEGKQ